MSPVLAISPAIGNGGIEKLGQHPIRIDGMIPISSKTSSLKFGETFQFATGKTSQKIENQMQI